MATQIDIHDPASTLANVVARARQGEDITISEEGKPLAKIVALSEENVNPRRAALGMFQGMVWMADDFDGPMSEEELKEWGL